MRKADILITHGLVVTFDQDMATIADGAIAIASGGIAGIGPTAQVLAEFHPSETIDASHHLVMPGLINAHTHGPMSLLRGLSDDLGLAAWLDAMRKASREVIRAETVELGAELAYAEMILGGTTTALDMYFFPEALIAAARRLGCRLMTGPVFIAHEVLDHIPAEERLARGRDFMREYKDEPLVTPCVMPHSPYGMPLRQLEHAQALASEFNSPISTHVSETNAEVTHIVAEYGVRPVQLLDRLGMLSPRTILAHAIHLTDDEIALLAQRGAVVAHCPVSNLKLGDGVAPIGRLLREHVQVTLGTDGPASSNDLDLWKVMRVAGILQRGVHQDPTLTSARDVARMVTIEAARALGLGDRIGSLEIGKRADIILVDLDHPHLVPLHDPYSLMVYAVGREDVSTVLIDGRVVVRDRCLLTLDLTRTIGSVRDITERIAK